jgi:hypothetical protein
MFKARAFPASTFLLAGQPTRLHFCHLDLIDEAATVAGALGRVIGGEVVSDHGGFHFLKPRGRSGRDVVNVFRDLAGFITAVLGEDLPKVLDRTYRFPGQTQRANAEALDMTLGRFAALLGRGRSACGARNNNELFRLLGGRGGPFPGHRALDEPHNRILKALAAGLTWDESARLLGTGCPSLKRLSGNIRAALGVRTIPEAILEALRDGGMLREPGEIFDSIPGLAPRSFKRT